jgi:thiamine-phosphate pyrophosphorylase
VRPRLVLITDAAFGDEAIVRCVRSVASALPTGALCVQVRDKRRLLPSLRLFALQLRRVTHDGGALLVINGHPELARDVGADGVHLGEDARRAMSVEEARTRFGRRAWISVAAHSDDDVRRAVDEGVDAVLVSPIFPTHALSPRLPLAPLAPLALPAAPKRARGTGALRSARTLADSRVAVFALGGVTPERARACAAAGADGIAVIRSLLASRAPSSDARAMFDAVARDGR